MALKGEDQGLARHVKTLLSLSRHTTTSIGAYSNKPVSNDDKVQLLKILGTRRSVLGLVPTQSSLIKMAMDRQAQDYTVQYFKRELLINLPEALTNGICYQKVWSERQVENRSK
jgi:hypothetical protein